MTELYKKKMSEIRKLSLKDLKKIALSNKRYLEGAGWGSYTIGTNKNTTINFMLKRDLESKYDDMKYEPLSKFRNIVLSIAKKIAKNHDTSIWNISLKFHKSMKTFGGTEYAGITFDSYAYEELSVRGNYNDRREELESKLNKIGWDFDDISSSAIQFYKL